jgi:hypothetical protein
MCYALVYQLAMILVHVLITEAHIILLLWDLQARASSKTIYVSKNVLPTCHLAR